MLYATLLSGCDFKEPEFKKTIEEKVRKDRIFDIPEIKIKARKPTREPEYLSQNEFGQLIDNIYHSTKKNPLITKDLYKAIIKKESSLNINAFNKRSKARGLGQILESTWNDMDTTCYYENAFNPEKNLEVTLKYLSWIPMALNQKNPKWNSLSEHEKIDQIIASYNWGIGRLKDNDWNFEKAPKETQDYKTFIYKELNILPQ